MQISDTVIEMIQDYTLVSNYLDNLCCALENGDVQLPNFIPVCADYTLTERLTQITEHINRMRGGANG